MVLARHVVYMPAPEPLQLGLLADEYLTIAEAARRVRVCERTIRRAIESGDLRAGRARASRPSRGAIRIRPVDLELWLFDDLDSGNEHASA